MRNYFKALQLPCVATREQITDALELGSPTAKAVSPKHRVDAYQILLDEDQRKLYADTVALYEAFHIASTSLQSRGGIDTNHWKKRLADFDQPDG